MPEGGGGVNWTRASMRPFENLYEVIFYIKANSRKDQAMASVKVVHFSDVLCVWAYVGQSNLDRLVTEFGPLVEVETHFTSVFPDVQGKITKQWATRGGFEGYGAHVAEVVARFDGLALHPDVWTKTRPLSSASPHLFIKAVELVENASGLTRPFPERMPIRAAYELRQAFFAEGRDIGTWAVQRVIAETIGLNFAAVMAQIESGAAIAQLAADYELSQTLGVQGSPTYILNEGRQKLFGNIGYSILSSNIRELLQDEATESATLCQ